MAEPSTPPRLADRLAAARQRLFVGRVPELELFRAALAAPDPPFAVLHLYGPGGIGKTTLLREYARLAGEAGRAVIWLDARSLDATPPGFLLGLGLALGLPDGRPPLEALPARPVLLVDTFEALAPLDAWLREVCLPQWPAQTLVVIAGRAAPAAAWSGGEWGPLTRTVALRNLRPEESQAYLATRGLAAADQAAIVGFTHGHPLALSLAADVLRQDGHTVPDLAHEPDIVKALLERFLQQIPSPQHRRALDACAHVRVTTETLLAEVLGPAAPDMFAWLRGLSFVEAGPEGLFPHDLARDVLDADLRWRNPDDYLALHRQVRVPIVRRLEASQGLEQLRAFSDLVYLHRSNPIMKAYFLFKELGSVYVEPARPADHAAVLAMTAAHEGPASAAQARYWLERQPEAFLVARGAGAEPLAFSAFLALDQTTPEDRAADPGVLAGWEYARRTAPPRANEVMRYARFLIDRDHYQIASPALNALQMVQATLWLTTPRLAWCFLAVHDPEYWHGLMGYIHYQPAPEAAFEIGGRRYTPFAHDWRVQNGVAWLEMMEGRELATDTTLEDLEAERLRQLIVLSEPEFAEAVRQALREFVRPEALAASPLMRSRLVVEQGGPDPAPAVLQDLLRAALASLQGTPRDEKLYRALNRTYLEPAASQDKAAEALGLPFNTYRYHLAQGLERVTDWLWQRELGGLDG